MIPRKIHPSITCERVGDAIDRYDTNLDNPGFCLACGEDAEGVEPDARNYVCEYCGAAAVFGAQEVMFTFDLPH